MKAIALAILATAILGIAAAAVLSWNQTLAYQAFATSGARVSDPGHNLVGGRWTGDPDVRRDGRSS